jgi:hypothetical protein
MLSKINCLQNLYIKRRGMPRHGTSAHRQLEPGEATIGGSALTADALPYHPWTGGSSTFLNAPARAVDGMPAALLAAPTRQSSMLVDRSCVLYPRPPSGKKKSSRKGKNREWGNGGI